MSLPPAFLVTPPKGRASRAGRLGLTQKVLFAREAKIRGNLLREHCIERAVIIERAWAPYHIPVRTNTFLNAHEFIQQIPVRMAGKFFIPFG